MIYDTFLSRMGWMKILIHLEESLIIIYFPPCYRWSKIAEHLPGRTDNEIKNYWRTRVIKQAKQLKCEVNSKQFRDALRHVWIPRLLERVRVSSEDQPGSGTERRRPNYCCNPVYAEPELRVSSNSDSGETTGHPIGNGSVTQAAEQGDSLENLWSDENIWFLRQQLCDEF